MKKIKLFTHTDLDGIGCAILTLLAFDSKEVDIEYCNYDDINEKVKEFIKNENSANYQFCFITDISINDEIAKEIDNRFFSFYLLDHHSTTLELNKYLWCDVRIENKDGIKTSGTELYYLWLVDRGYLPNSESLDKFVEVVRNYDTWRWSTLGDEGIICKQINDLLYLYGRQKFIDWCIDEIAQECFPTLYETEEILLFNKQKEIDDYVKEKNEQISFLKICDKMCGVVFAEKNFSELGNKLCQMHPDIDFIAMINLGKGTISYRTIKEDIDLGEIAKSFGGGGHPKASGSTFPKFYQLDIIKKVFQNSLLYTFNLW